MPVYTIRSEGESTSNFVAKMARGDRFLCARFELADSHHLGMSQPVYDDIDDYEAAMAAANRAGLTAPAAWAGL
jgi:hypothetical protein